MASRALTTRSGPVNRGLMKELPGLQLSVTGSVIAGLGATAAVVAQALALAHLLAGAVTSGPSGRVAGWFALLAAGIVGRALAALAGELFAGAGASRAKATLRSRLATAALSAPSGVAPGGAARSRGAGDLATVAGRGLDALDVYVGRCLPDLVLAVAAPVALLAVVGALDWLSALIMGVVIVLFPVFGALVGRASITLAGERWRQVESLGLQVADLFEGLPALRAFGRTAAHRANIVQANEALRHSSSKVLRVAFLSALVLDTLGSVSVALVAVPLGLRLLTGSVQLSTALAVLIVAPEVVLPLRRASAEFHESTEGLAALASALALVVPPPAGANGANEARPLAAPGPSGSPVPSPRANRVELVSVTVELPGRPRPVLDAASLVISPGETVVLVGPSGAGKSMSLRLLLGFALPSSGYVAVGGQPLSAFDPDQWRDCISYLPEHPTLLGASLAGNLRLADRIATDAELRCALNSVGAPELTRMLATPLGDGGRPVSAGERQRIALARVLLRARGLYLLDEPTAHLDPEAEAIALEALQQALAGRSALIVSHRPAVLAIADRVVALDNGGFTTVEDQALRLPERLGGGL